MPQPRLPLTTHRLIHELGRRGLTTREIGKKTGVSSGCVSDYLKKPLAEPLEDETKATMPRALLLRDASPIKLDVQGRWLILSDLHLPYHAEGPHRHAIRDAKKRGIKGVLLNGDVLDSHEISNHDKDPNAVRYVEELRLGRQYLRYLRREFPRARIVYKEGNHEDRLGRYVLPRAPALVGLECLTMPELLRMDDAGVEWVADKRAIELGRLVVLHGHEYRGGSPQNPARWLFNKTLSVSLCGHFHRTDECGAKTVKDKLLASWSVGCLCDLNPLWLPNNQWNHGYAIVEVSRDGDFEVENRRVQL